MRRHALAALITAAALLPAASAMGQSVEDCIAQNGTRYATPGDATTHQYVDSSGLCADAQNDGTDVTITPVGGKKPPKRQNTSTTGGTPAPAPAPAATPQPSETPASGTTTAAKPAPKPPKVTPSTPQEAATAAATVEAALQRGSAADGLSAPFPLSGSPGTVAIAVLAGLGLAGIGAGLRRLNRG